MKKGNIINLIKYYSEKDDLNFKNEAYLIAKEFDKLGDYQLSEYIKELLREPNDFTFKEDTKIKTEQLSFPERIKEDIKKF
ncbi:hypothetical protein [Mesomycoplasma lagogenitalium]|uniref:Uncharacterized protein n=1 Tax=Mesomycoplasma lagogenitalium TaxID=171286 RepID=A0ABY8LTE9_9BACT|nr:hypothetical protein [Mesomycoplasma lagogenitalium]WGI36517.1 hypothetical protein QEG99_03565 [Mesomycoplasma lagogenitalium]